MWRRVLPLLLLLATPVCRYLCLLAASTVVLRQFTYRPTINRDRDSTLRRTLRVCVFNISLPSTNVASLAVITNSSQ